MHSVGYRCRRVNCGPLDDHAVIESEDNSNQLDYSSSSEARTRSRSRCSTNVRVSIDNDRQRGGRGREQPGALRVLACAPVNLQQVDRDEPWKHMMMIPRKTG